MASTDFLPSRDQDLEAWALNFDQLITATPTAYSLVALDATDFHSIRLDFSNKLALATDPVTRTKVAVTNKNVAKAALVAAARSLARRVNADPDTTDGQRDELGLTVPDGTKTPVPAPASKPVLVIESSNTLTHGLRVADEFTPASRAKAVGAAGAEIYVYRGATPPATLSDYEYHQLQTRSRGTLEHPDGTAGKTVYVIARWINPRGERGPWSSPVSATIAA